MDTPEPEHCYENINIDRNSTNSSYSTSSQPLTKSDITSVHSNPSIESFDTFNDTTNSSLDSNRLSRDALSNYSYEDNNLTEIDSKNSNQNDGDVTSLDEIDNVSVEKRMAKIGKNLSPYNGQSIIYREHDDKDDMCALSPGVKGFSYLLPPFETKPITTYLEMFGNFNNSYESRYSEPVIKIVRSPLCKIKTNTETKLKRINEKDTIAICDNIQNNKLLKVNPESDIDTNITITKQSLEHTIKIIEENVGKDKHSKFSLQSLSNKESLENEIINSFEDNNHFENEADEIKVSAITRQNAFDSCHHSDDREEASVKGYALTKVKLETTKYNCDKIQTDQHVLITSGEVEDSCVRSPRISPMSPINMEEILKPKGLQVSKISSEIQKQLSSIKNRSKIPPPLQIRSFRLPVVDNNLDDHSSNPDKSCNSHKMQKQENFSDSCDLDANFSKEPAMEQDLIVEMDVSPWLLFKNITEDGPNVKGGHPDAVIVNAIELTEGSLHQEAFLTTYCTYVTPDSLIEKIFRRHSMHISHGRITKSRELLKLLIRVVLELPYAELTSELIRRVTKIIHSLICFEDLIIAKSLRQLLIDKYKKKQLEQQSCAAINVEWNFLTPNRKETVLDYSAEVIAEQITILDAELFAKLPESELLHWAINQCQSRCPNLAVLTDHFNKLSFWVTSRMLEQFEARDREKYTLRFIRIMKHLRKINNFSSAVAILLALDSTVISRLNNQNDIMDGLEEYKALIDNSYNFRACRQALNEAQPPCIPHIAMTLKDLTALHNGSPSNLSDGNINFSKRWKQFIILDGIKRLRKVEYSFKRNDSIMAVFANFDKIFHEDTMWNMSYHIKPRG